MRVKVRAKRALFENGMSVCQGGIFEVSLKRAADLKRIKAVEIIERIQEPDKLPEIIKLREQGLTLEAIGEKLNLSKVAVYKRLRKEGLAGRGSLVNQVRDLQERISKLEKEIEEIKTLVIRRL